MQLYLVLLDYLVGWMIFSRAEKFVPTAWRQNEEAPWHDMSDPPEEGTEIFVAYKRCVNRNMRICGMVLVFAGFISFIVKIVSLL